MKFRKKPIVIEAEQFMENRLPLPFSGRGNPCCFSLEKGWYIFTLEGNHNLIDKDWVIKGIKGEFYPCKPDIFEATYERVEG